MKRNRSVIGLHDLIEGFLFSLSAEGKSPKTARCYQDLLYTLCNYAHQHKWPEDLQLLDVQKFREFLSWTGSRKTIQAVHHGGSYIRKAKPSTAFHYFRATRLLFNWAVAKGYLESSPISSIRFKPLSHPPIQAYPRDDL